MTVCGVVVAGAGAFGFAWSDTETFDARDNPAGSMNKLLVNAAGCLASVGSGFVGMSREVAPIIAEARNVDMVTQAMTGRLCQRAARMGRDPLLDPARIAQHCELLVGFSPRLGRMMAFELAGHSLFIARPASRAALPWVPGMDTLDPEDPYAVAAVVREQLDVLRQDHPGARGGLLSIAMLRPGRIECGPLLDLEAPPEAAWLWPGLRRESEQVEETAA